MTPLSLTISSELRDLFLRALSEDIGSGDITTLATVPADKKGQACLLAKAAGILCGQAVWNEIFSLVDPEVSVEWKVSEAAWVTPKTLCAEMQGPLRSILIAERTALNFLQRLSGIATLTRSFVEKVRHTSAKIFDTRKTTPLWRTLEKYAVRAGGGVNHRLGLYDMFLIKDNHIAAAGGLSAAILAVMDYRIKMNCYFPIEVETKNLDEVREALNFPVDRIMFDNMTLEEMKQAVQMVQGRCHTEASGGVMLETVQSIAETGVDYISIGALTHSAPALDLSLLVEMSSS